MLKLWNTYEERLGSILNCLVAPALVYKKGKILDY